MIRHPRDALYRTLYSRGDRVIMLQQMQFRPFYWQKWERCISPHRQCATPTSTWFGPSSAPHSGHCEGLGSSHPRRVRRRSISADRVEVEAPAALLMRAWACGPSPCLFAFLAFRLLPGGALRSRPRPPLRSGHKARTVPRHARFARGGQLCARTLHCAPLLPGQISIARRQKEQAATWTPAVHRKVQP